MRQQAFLPCVVQVEPAAAASRSPPPPPIINPVYDYADSSNNGWDELANFITTNQGDGNSAATPANIRIINADDMDAAAMAAVNTKVTTAGVYVTLDLSDTGNSFDSNTVTKEMMSDNIKDNTRIKGIALPEGLSSIGTHAFSDCASLVSVDLPEGLSSIGNSAFSDCASLVSVDLPASVNSIGTYIFSDCTSLADMNLSECTNLSSINQGLFSGCTSLASVDLPEGVTDIWEHVFASCTSLADIILPTSVNYIGEEAFSNCTSLASVTFNSGSIGISDAGALPGDLRTKYLAGGETGGSGTYTRSPPEDTWTKQ